MTGTHDRYKEDQTESKVEKWGKVCGAIMAIVVLVIFLGSFIWATRESLDKKCEDLETCFSATDKTMTVDISKIQNDITEIKTDMRWIRKNLERGR